MSKQIVISIKPDGRVTAEVSGVMGTKCMEYLGLIEELIDGTIETTEPTAEYYRSETYLDTDQSLTANQGENKR